MRARQAAIARRLGVEQRAGLVVKPGPVAADHQCAGDHRGELTVQVAMPHPDHGIGVRRHAVAERDEERLGAFPDRRDGERLSPGDCAQRVGAMVRVDVVGVVGAELESEDDVAPRDGVERGRVGSLVATSDECSEQAERAEAHGD